MKRKILLVVDDDAVFNGLLRRQIEAMGFATVGAGSWAEAQQKLGEIEPSAIILDFKLPDSNADYLNNRPPPYPALSKRLGEQGKVVVRVFIDTDGNATQAEIRTSSGYDRLDQTALKTAQAWKYVPGKVNGEPKAMWFNVPINFVLE